MESRRDIIRDLEFVREALQANRRYADADIVEDAIILIERLRRPCWVRLLEKLT